MNNKKLEPIEATREDPVTGFKYNFKATPPVDIDLVSLNGDLSLPDFIIVLFWQVLSGKWNTEKLPDLKQQVIDVMPVSQLVIEKIKVQIEEGDDEELINFAEDISFYLTIEEGPGPQWGNITPVPSAELITLLDNEVMNSPAILMATSYFVGTNLVELVKDNSTNTQVNLGEASRRKEPSSRRIKVDKEYIKYGLHAVAQQFNPTPKKSGVAPQDVAATWEEHYGQPVNRLISEYGMGLTEIESRVMEAIIKKLSDTNYKGNAEPIKKEDLLVKFKGKEPASLKYIDTIPRIEIGQRELVRLAGMDGGNQGHVERVVAAIDHFMTTQYCFYYDRMAMKNGRPELDKNHNIKKEEVYTVSTIFDIKKISDKSTQKLTHYEIQPASVFLDQRDGYFMLIPYNWRKEVRELVGEKKASKYLLLFLLYLRFQFEQKRRKNAQADKRAKKSTKTTHEYKLKYRWVIIAQTLGMPESQYKGQKKRTLAILDDAYLAAQQLGYLISYSKDGESVTFILNPDKYPQPSSDFEGPIMIE